MLQVTLDTKQKAAAFNDAHVGRAMKIGDIVQVGSDRCPTCFSRHRIGTNEAELCWARFPPVSRARASCGVNCPTCDNAMVNDALKSGVPVIMCCNPHCSNNGLCFKPPTIRLERLFE